jgi:hypothetical protein
MILHHPKPRPEPWARFIAKTSPWKLPFLATEYVCDWAVYLLSNWSFLETLEYLGSLSILIAVVFYFSESGSRVKQKHYQAWQVINTAQGKGGSGGRVEALQELVGDNVPLTGVDVSEAFLQGLRLKRANLVRANFHNADVRNGALVESNLADATLAGANFRRADLQGSSLRGADLTDIDLEGANLSDVDLSETNLENADLRGANLHGVRWTAISNVKMANLAGAIDAPKEFILWALQHGAVQQNP